MEEEVPKEKTCMQSFCSYFNCINPWYKPEIPPGHYDLALVLQKCKFGDIFLIRTNVKLDTAVAVSFLSFLGFFIHSFGYST